MKSKSLLLLLAALAVGVLTYYLSGSSHQHSINVNSSLVPDLAKNINSVSKFTVTEAGNTVLTEVSKAKSGWVIDNRDGYQANISAIRNMFNALSEAKLTEAKTSNPENYTKLGVEDIDNEKAQGILFSIEGVKEATDIIFGNAGSSGKNTQYIRRKGEKQSWLINKNLKLNRDVTDWLGKNILDIPPERIKSVQIKHPDGSEVNITSDSDSEEEYEYKLDAPIPQDKKLFESEIYQVANALSFLQLKDVISFSKLNTDTISPVITEFKTFDGLTVTLKAYSIEDENYFTIDVVFSSDDVDQTIVNDENQAESTSDSAIKSDPKAAEELALKSNVRLSGWAYLLPTITQDALTKKLEDFFIEEDA